MINFKSPYDSTEIREGLMNIKQSQMELLNELKNENHILKKYTPNNPIFEENSNSNIFSSPGYSVRDPYESHINSNQKPPYGQASSFLSSNLPNQQANAKFSSTTKNLSSLTLQKQLQSMTEQFHRMKKNYFTEKQKNKDMVLHMEFAASIHNMILKDVLQGNQLENIRTKVRTEVQNYQAQFAEFKAFGIQQAFNIINLQSDSSFVESRTPRRTQIFPPKQDNNSEILKQLNDLKCQLREISLQKQRKSQQVILMKSQNDYTISLLNKEIEMKNGKINQLVSEIIRQKESIKSLSTENNDFKTNLDRLKSQLQRNLNKIEVLQNFQRKATENIDKEHKYMKYVKELEDKVVFLEKETREKSKLIEIHQQNVNKTNEMVRNFKTDNERMKTEIEELKQGQQKKSSCVIQLQQKIQFLQKSHLQQLALTTKRNQTQQASLKQHITELKKNLQQLLKQQQSYKHSQQTLQQIKHRKIQTLRLSKTIDHLWKIKEVQYENINQVLTQLNLIKAEDIQATSQRIIEGMGQSGSLARRESGSSVKKMSSSSREKSRERR